MTSRNTNNFKSICSSVISPLGVFPKTPAIIIAWLTSGVRGPQTLSTLQDWFSLFIEALVTRAKGRPGR